MALLAAARTVIAFICAVEGREVAGTGGGASGLLPLGSNVPGAVNPPRGGGGNLRGRVGGLSSSCWSEVASDLTGREGNLGGRPGRDVSLTCGTIGADLIVRIGAFAASASAFASLSRFVESTTGRLAWFKAGGNLRAG